MRYSIFSFLLFLGLCSCSPSSMEDYQREGEALARVLISDLQKIQTQEQLIKEEPNLKKHFEAFVTLMIQAREYQQKHREDVVVEPSFEHGESEALKAELRRVYAIEGGRESVERTQQEALVRLDAYERNLIKQKELNR